MSNAMSDEQVSNELKKMTAFIRQEALEKAREIQIKADEEFAIEKSKLVRQETSSVDSTYAKKHKQASMSQQITKSTLSNKTRLKVLSSKQELLNDLFDKVKGLLDGQRKDEGAYGRIMKALILEGLFTLSEEKVSIRAKSSDKNIAKTAIEGAKQDYKEKTGKNVDVALDEKNPLAEGSAGGVSVISGGGKIDINNTLEERLRLLELDALPMVRTILFGQNENRRFFD